MTSIRHIARTLQDVSRLTPALLKTRTAILLGLLLISTFIPSGNVALSQTSTGSSSYTFTKIDVPNARHTFATGINNSGQIVGIFTDTTGSEHGFLRYADGTFAAIDIPGANRTNAWGINNVGQIVGWFADAAANHGFVMQIGGTPTKIDVPGSISAFALGINDAGQIVGGYDLGTRHGFIRSAGGTLATIDYPDPNAVNTQANGINNSGQIVGTYCVNNPNCYYHSFMVNAGGTFTGIDNPNGSDTQANGINAVGQIVGSWTPVGSSPSLGFLRDVSGAVTTIGAPGGVYTIAYGINGAGQIVGFYSDSTGSHGFLAQKLPIIAIDAGHGRNCWATGPGIPPYPITGTVGPSGPGVASEDDLVLTIAQNLALDLRQRGYRVIETRSDQCLLARPEVIVNGDGTTSLDITDDLRERVLRVAVAKSPVDVFVSIHLNGSLDPSVNGTEVWVDGGTVHSQAEALAMQIAASQACLSPTAQPCTNPALPIRTGFDPSKPGVKYVCCDAPWVAGKTIFVLRGVALAGAVAVLDEFAFLTNSTQESSMLNATYRQQQVVLVISGAIRRYMGTP